MENFRNDDLMYQCVTASYIIGVGKSAVTNNTLLLTKSS